MLSFSGRFHHAIDSKGRVSVPAQFRDQLLNDRILVLAPYRLSRENCLDVYPWSEWEKLLARFSELPRFSVQAQHFEMQYLSRSHQCEIDAAGRILVPPALRDYAGLTKDVVFFGMNLRMRMMDAERTRRMDAEMEAQALAAGEAAMFGDTGL